MSPLQRRRRESFAAEYTYTVEGCVIAIIDLDRGNKSVTNDIDNVIADIKADLASDLSGHAIIYRDSMGVWDGIKLSETGNVTFYGLGESNQAKATARLLHLAP